MYKFISPEGKTVETETIKEFAVKYNVEYKQARFLACGRNASLNGWISTHPKAKKRRERIQTVLVNTITGEREQLGYSVKAFAKKHRLNANHLYQLVNNHKIVYRGWILEATANNLKYDNANIPDRKF